jgi:cytoskeletal protein RodZ
MSDGYGGAHTEPRIGRTLELARSEQGLSLKQVEDATKIRAGYLKELERENFDVLPAVYVRGYLKTYANFLRLDGEALVRELKRRRTPQHKPTHAEPRESASFLDRLPIFLDGATVGGSRRTVEKDAGSTLIPAGVNRYLYLASGALVALVLAAVTLALALPGDERPAVSQVRGPLISQAPAEPSPAGGGVDPRAHQPRRERDERDAPEEGPRLQRPAGSPDEVAAQTAQTNVSLPAQDPVGATATPSASPAAETATAEPDAASTPPTTESNATRTPPTPEASAQSSATGFRAEAPAAQSGGAPVMIAPDTRRVGTTESPRIIPSRPRGGDDFEVEIVVGSDDLVRITGDPTGDTE